VEKEIGDMRGVLIACLIAPFLLMGFAGCKNPSSVSAGTVETPTFSPAGGTYSDPVSVVIATATAGAGIRYTTDGSTPSASYGVEYDGTPISVTGTITITAVGWQDGWTTSESAIATYALSGSVVAPSFTPAGGTYAAGQAISIASTTPGVTIHYTTDGSEPTVDYGTTYSGVRVNVASTQTLKAVAFKTGLPASMVTSADYTITGTTGAPVFNPGGGTYPDTQSVTIRSATVGATIRYTTDGSYPTSSTGTVYSDSSPVTVSQNTTLRAIAYMAGLNDSTVSSATYTIGGTVATPYFTPAQGSYPALQSVAIATTTAGAAIRYTLDGTTPTSTYGTLYAGPVPVVETTNIRAIAYKANWIDSAAATGTWSIALDSAGNVGQWSSVALSGSDVLVAYYDLTNLDLKLVRGAIDGSSWSPGVKVDWPNSVGQYVSMAENGGRIGISYYDATNGDLRYAYSTDGGSSWTRRAVDTAAANVGQWSAVALNGLEAAISYYDVTNGDLKVAWSADGGDTWTTQSVDTTGNVGQYTSIAFNGTKIYVSYYDVTNGDLKFAWAPTPGGAWTISSIDTAGNVGQYTALRYDSGTSTIWVSSYDAGNGNLKVADSPGNESSWVVLPVVDSLGSVGQWSSLAVSGSTVVVSYYEDYVYSLKVAVSTNSGASWTISVPDTGGVGQYTSVALSGANIWVTYYDLTNLDLKLALSTDGGGTCTLY
jgi:hypothetical protein